MAKNINTTSNWLNMFTKVFGCSYSLQLCLTMATIGSVMRELSQNSKAIQKRQCRAVQREKKRRAVFVHDYIRTKYPNLFTEANSVYQELVEKYPSKPNFTKTYYFKKWQKKIDESRSQLFIPHLPILSPLQNLCSEQQEEDTEQEPHQQEEHAEQEPQQQEEHAEQEPQQQEEHAEQEPQQQEEHSEQEPHQQEEHSEQEPHQQEEHAEQEPQQQEEHAEQEPGHTEVIQTDDEASLHYTGMSLNEMSQAVEELITALQSDRELMDLVEGFDLPDSVWQNELAIPDYVLESELDW